MDSGYTGYWIPLRFSFAILYDQLFFFGPLDLRIFGSSDLRMDYHGALKRPLEGVISWVIGRLGGQSSLRKFQKR
jgi:hypothetical protein